jgi:hypothetical protein
MNKFIPLMIDEDSKEVGEPTSTPPQIDPVPDPYAQDFK